MQESSQQNEPTSDPIGATHDEILARYLETHDEHCPSCRYSLRRLRTTRCPECGHALRLVIGSTETNTRFFLFGFAGLASAFGFVALSMVWIGFMTVMFGPGPPSEHILLMLAAAIVLAALMIAWSHGAARFRRASHATRLALALAAWLMPFAALAAFTALFFMY